MRTAVVTGAARGIGRAISERLIDDGFTVWIVDADAAEVSRTAEAIGAIGCTVDVTDDLAVADLASQVKDCAVLVNNAAVWFYTRLADTSIEDARRVLDVNVLGPLRLMQQFAPGMARISDAAIVNVSSVTAKYSPTGVGIYPASKAALEALTRIAAVEFGSLGIRCNAVGPGIVPTDRTRAHYGDAATIARRGATLPAGRFGQVAEVADVVAFFCSPAARYVTGQVVYVDGGYTAAGADYFRVARDAVHAAREDRS